MKNHAFLLIFAMAMLTGCTDSTTQAAPSSSGSSTPVVQTMQATAEEVAGTIDLAAKVEADPVRVIRIFPPASGRLISFSVRLGDRVSTGQTVAVLQSSDIASARSDYEKAKVEMERAERAEKRADLLFEHEAMSQKDVEDARAAAESARSELARSRQRLQMLGVSEDGDSDRITVRAPRSGVITDISAAPGELSKSLESSNPLLTIADLSSVWILGDVYEKDLATVRVGSLVTISVNSYPDETWKGTIAAVSDVLDPTTRTLKARVVLRNTDHRLKPEMFATIHLAQTKRKVILLPASAVVHDGEKAEVFVQTGAGKYEQRQVSLGPQQGQKIEIQSGIASGDIVVTQGAELLRQEGPGA